MKHLTSKFKISASGPLTKFVGIEAKQADGSITLHQSTYIAEMAERFRVSEAKEVGMPMHPKAVFNKTQCPITPEGKGEMSCVPYRAAVGSVVWAAWATRPDVQYAASVLAQFSGNPAKAHWTALKRLIIYLKSTKNRGITYTRTPTVEPVGYCDSDWAGCTDTRKSRSGGVIMMAGAPIIFHSPKQKCVATSTCQAEYVSAAKLASSFMFLKNSRI